jgi:hypothetical protein
LTFGGCESWGNRTSPSGYTIWLWKICGKYRDLLEKDRTYGDLWMFTLWLFNIAMGNGPCIDGLPNSKMVIFHGYVK